MWKNVGDSKTSKAYQKIYFLLFVVFVITLMLKNAIAGETYHNLLKHSEQVC
jgi:hypothetical protein